MARIVVLDAHALNPGDLSWNALAEFGELVVHARTEEHETVARLHGASVAITNKTKLDAAALRIPGLRGVVVLATGYNVVDTEAARTLGIPVCNAPGYSTASVVEHTFALLFELVRRAGLHDVAVRAGEWASQPEFCFWKTPQSELFGRNFGVVGYGSIGRAVARVAEAFGMHVLATPSRRAAEPGVTVLSVEELLPLADVVSLHCPLTPDTRELLNYERLKRMKRSAFLVNTARGALINERDLARALSEGLIAGAGLDVLTVEPPSIENALVRAPHCVITPHLAWTTLAARQRLMEITYENVAGIVRGPLQNVVNGVPAPAAR